MSKTEVSGKQIKDGSIELVDLSSAVSNDITQLKSDVATLQTDVATKADAGTLAPVATSGSYNDLSDKPSIPSLTQVEGDISSLDGRVTAVEADVASLQNANAPLLGDLGDVSISQPSNDQILKYYMDGWINASISTVATSGSYNDLTNKPTIPASLDDLSDVAVSSAAKGQFIVHNGTSFVNSNTIEASGAAVKPLIVKGAASQTANLLEAQNHM